MFLSLLTCKETLARLDDFLDRELSPREVTLVERHLKICRHCSKIYDFEADFLRELKQKVQQVETSDENLSGLMNRIRAALPADEVESAHAE